MKKLIHVFMIFLIIIFLSACFTDHITNIDIKEGNLYISGRWPQTKSNITNKNSISASIPSKSEKIILTVKKEDGSNLITREVTKTSDENFFTITIEGLEVGNWIVSVSAENSSGKIIGTTQSKTVLISAVNNTVSAVFGPENYAELFLEDSFYNLMSDYTHHFAVISYLGIEKIDIYNADSYKQTYEYYDGETSTTNSGFYYISKESFSSWETIDPYHMSKDNESAIATGSGIVATMSYTYNSNNKISSAVYSNISNFIVNNTVDYNSNDRISEMNTSATLDGTQVYSESVTVSYLNGNLVGASWQESTQTEKGGVDFSYSNGRISSMTDFQYKDGTKTTERTDSVVWKDGLISTREYSESYTDNENNQQDRSGNDIFTYDESTGFLTNISRIGTNNDGSGSSSTYTDNLEYSYENNLLKTITEKSTSGGNEYFQKKVIFNYDTEDRVNSVYYYTYTDPSNESSETLMFYEILTYKE